MDRVHDQRRYRRTALDAAAKLYCPLTRRYRPARALNVSSGGALLETYGQRPMSRGESVHVLIQGAGQGAVARQDDLLPAQVMRCERAGTRIAVRFTHLQALPAAA